MFCKKKIISKVNIYIKAGEGGTYWIPVQNEYCDFFHSKNNIYPL